MTTKQTAEQQQLSKFMSLLLRHNPPKYNLTFNEKGAISLSVLEQTIQSNKRFEHVQIEDIIEVVITCEKQRYNIQNGFIMARYGHSKVDVIIEESTPPTFLLHGTNEKALPSIWESGLRKMNRKFVHMSETEDFALLSAKRRGEPVLLKVDTALAIEQGVQFYYAGNQVWLSTDIPAACLSLIEEKK